MAFACLFVPDFAVQAVVRMEPDLREKAVVVLEGAPPLTRVLAANREARAVGVETGMTKVQAEAFSNVARRWRSRAQEATAHTALLDCAWTISPRVEDKLDWGSEQLPGAVVLDIAGCEKLFGSQEKIAGDLKRAAASVGLDANVAIAGNPEAAVCVARGFSGVTIVAPGEESRKLGALPVSSLPVTAECLETFARWGIRTCEELAALPEIAVVERFGQEGRRWQLLAQGAEPRPLMAKEPEPAFEECLELEFPVELLDPLLFVLNRLLEQLCVRLRMHVLAASEIRVTLTLQKNSQENKIGSKSKEALLHERTLRLPVPAKKSKFLLKLLKLDMEAHPPHAPVTAVKMVAVPTRPCSRQMGLYLPLSPEPEKLEVTIARIRGTVGQGRVGAPVLLDTHRPNAFRQGEFVLTERNEKAPAVHRPATAALRIYRPPLAATVELYREKPALIVCDGAQRRVLSYAGPWRTKGDWWSETAWARDEWDVLMHALRPKQQPQQANLDIHEREETALYRLYKDLRSRRWFVEGIYD